MGTGQPGGHLTQHPTDRALQLPYARLPGVLTSDHPQRRVLQVHLVGGQAGPIQLPRQQVRPGDLDLLVLGVTVELHQLHPVQQRRRDHLQHVGGGQEDHIGQIQLDIQVVVPEGVVLRRVEHLQQRRGRVAPVVGAELVHLVQQDHRIHGAGVGDRPYDPAG